MAASGSLAAVAVAAVIHNVGAGAWYSSLLLPAILAVLAVCGAAWAQRLSPRQIAVRGLVATLGAAALLLTPMSVFTWGVAGFAICVGAGFAVNVRGLRMVAGVAVGTGLALVACHVFDAVMFSTQFASMPGWATTAIAGVGFSLVLPLALLPRHVMPFGDAVDRKYKASVCDDEEVASLATRSYKLWRSADPELAEDDANRSVLQEAVERVLDAAASWQTVASGASTTNATDLDERLTVMEAKLEAAADDQVRNELRNAQRALIKQRDYLSDIANQRERIAARMQSYVATLEQLRLAMVTVESTRASQGSPELATLLGQLESVELGSN